MHKVTDAGYTKIIMYPIYCMIVIQDIYTTNICPYKHLWGQMWPQISPTENGDQCKTLKNTCTHSEKQNTHHYTQ